MKLIPVYIEWIDAIYEDGNCKAKDLRGPALCINIGWLIGDENDFISIAQEYHPESEEWRHVSHIPKKYITVMRRGIRGWKK